MPLLLLLLPVCPPTPGLRNNPLQWNYIPQEERSSSWGPPIFAKTQNYPEVKFVPLTGRLRFMAPAPARRRILTSAPSRAPKPPPSRGGGARPPAPPNASPIVGEPHPRPPSTGGVPSKARRGVASFCCCRNRPAELQFRQPPVRPSACQPPVQGAQGRTPQAAPE